MTTKQNSLEVLKKSFDLKIRDIQSLLPSNIPSDKFRTVVMTAIAGDKYLLEACETPEGRKSIILSSVACARDGLIPDKKEAAFVVYNTKDPKTGRWNKVVQYMPMVKGLIKTMTNSGKVNKVTSAIVHSGDTFGYEMGDLEKITHVPAPLNKERGEPIGAYAIVHLKNGDSIREVMRLDEIEKVRKSSKTPDRGPWVDWWEEMARKTVIRRAYKSAPSSSDVDRVIEHDDSHFITSIEDDKAQPNAQIERPKKPEPQSALIDVEEDGSISDLSGFSFISWNGEVIEAETPDEIEEAALAEIASAPDLESAQAIVDQVKTDETMNALDNKGAGQ